MQWLTAADACYKHCILLRSEYAVNLGGTLGSKPCVDSEGQGLKLATGSFTMGFSSERGLLKKKKKSSGQMIWPILRVSFCIM